MFDVSKATLLSIIFSSSLTLPGNRYSIKRSMAYTDMFMGSFPNSLQYLSIKCFVRTGMSSFLSLRGGIYIGITLSR